MRYVLVTGFVICLLGIGLAAAGTSTSVPSPTSTPAHTFAYVLAAGNTVENTATPTSQIITPGGQLINESCFENSVIKSGTITVPISNTTNPTEDEINERHNISRNAIIALTKEFNVPANETVTLGCEFKKGICTYNIVKPCPASALSAFPGPAPAETLMTPTTIPTAPTQKTPAFEAIFAISAVLVAILVRRR